MVFKELCDDYLAYNKNLLSNSTYYNRECKIRINLIPYFGSYEIEDITPEDVKNWKIEMLQHTYKKRSKDCKYSDYSLNDMYSCLVKVLNYAMDVYGLETNAATTLGKFKQTSLRRIKKNQFWTLTEYKMFTNVISDEKWRLVFDVLYFTGARLGEARALQWSDLHEQYISITKTLDDKPCTTARIKEPKNQYSIRDVRLPSSLYVRLLAYKSKILDVVDFAEDWFILGNEKPASKTNIRYRKEMYCQKAGLQPISLNGFRHSHVSLLMNSDKNVNLLTIAKRMGHKDATRILKVYGHMWPNQQIELDDTLEIADKYINEVAL